MQKSALWLTAVLALLTVANSSQVRAEDGESGHEGWVLSFEKAQEMAADGEKDILMKFTGSDWCPPCIKLEKEVMSKDLFKEKVPQDFVMLYLDSPRAEGQPAEEKAQYDRLSGEYKIRGVPTVILADPAGRPYAQFVGFGGEAPEAYVAKLQEAKENRVKRDELLAKAATAEGIEKAKLLDGVVKVVGEELAFSMYTDVIEDIITLDADNQAGLKDAYETKLRTIQLEEKLNTMMSELRGVEVTDEVLAKFDALIEEFQPDAEMEQRIRFYKAVPYLNASEFDKAKPLLEDAMKMNAESQVGMQIKSIMSQLFKEDGEKDQ